MSAAESEAAVERLAEMRKDMGVEGFANYAFLALGMLGHAEPAVLGFILDRADERVSS